MANLDNKIKQYQDFIIEILNEHALLHQGLGELEDQVLADRQNNHFQLTRIGWQDGERIETILLHFDIKTDGKIWLQTNWTTGRVAEDLLLRGVPKSDIVLGLHPPEYRQYTEFAVA